MVQQASSDGLAWFQDAKFGMFIHWGLYSLIGKQEWVMHTDRIPVPEYEKLASQFNPTRFDAEEWVAVAADAGQKYIVITSRHHDGFSMYDTALSDYKVTKTPFGRDPLAELAAAVAKRRDLKLGFYVSLLDWRHPAYRFRRESGLAWSDYLGFLHGQVRELCTNYSEVACIWFDGDWPDDQVTPDREYFRAGGSFEYEQLYDMVHTLQPHAVIQNNRHGEPLPGEDVQGFEQHLPGEEGPGFPHTQTLYGQPLEVCMTINDHWGWSKDDRNVKSVRRLVHVLARSAALGGNLLLIVGPPPEGEIHPLHADRLRQVGRWLAANGESIYATRAGALPPRRDLVSTRRGETHYLHSLDYVGDCVPLDELGGLKQARLTASGEEATILATERGPAVFIPPAARDPYDTVVTLA